MSRRKAAHPMSLEHRGLLGASVRWGPQRRFDLRDLSAERRRRVVAFVAELYEEQRREEQGR